LFIEFALEDVIFAIIEIKLTRRSPDSKPRYRSLEQYISKKNNAILAFEKMWTSLQYIFN
jgi:hypothetical protein